MDKENKQSQSVQEEEQIKELLFSGGAGCIGFMMGYLHGLIEIVGKEKLKEYKLGGVSAGNAAALFFHLAIHQDKYDMKYFHETETYKYFATTNKKYFGLFTSHKVINENALNYCNIIKEMGQSIPNINGIYHCVVTEWQGGFNFKKVVLDEFHDDSLLSSAIQSSCQIPFFTAPKLFQKHQGRYFLDGGFKGTIPYKYEHSQKVYINMLPKHTNVYAEMRKKTKNLTSLHITEGYGIQFPRDYYMWSENWNDNMFLKGYLASKQNVGEIKKAFGIENMKTFSDCNSTTVNDEQETQQSQKDSEIEDTKFEQQQTEDISELKIQFKRKLSSCFSDDKFDTSNLLPTQIQL